MATEAIRADPRSRAADARRCDAGSGFRGPASFVDLACRPVDIGSLAAFRVLFGAVMAIGMVRFIAAGWVHDLYIAPRFFFPFEGFEWARPWPGAWMYVHFTGLAVLATGIASGFCYRACAAL